MSSDMEGVVVSPIAEDPADIPEVSLTDYVFSMLETRMPQFVSKPWVVDVITGESIKFCDVESQSRRVASALSRRGFKKGHVLYFVTYDVLNLYVVQLAVWRLGGAVRGSYQGENVAEYVRQMKEIGSRFVLVDAETAPKLQEATASLEWPVELLSVGDVTVPGATSFSQLLEDDGTAFPEKVEINPREDFVVMPNTSGSTGPPKAAVHVHHSIVALLYSMRNQGSGLPIMTLAHNYAVANFILMISGLFLGKTIHFITKFRSENYLEQLLKYKPGGVMIYPFVATWFSRSAELDQHDMTFLKVIIISGSVLDPGTLRQLETRLDSTLLFQGYGLSECIGVANSGNGFDFSQKPIKTMTNEGELCLSSGKLGRYVQAKVIDPDSGHVLGRCQRGEILVRAPHSMKGYLRADQTLDRSSIDADGWHHTGDLGFFDEEGNIYIKERKSFQFKAFGSFVSPSEVESVLQEHEAVQAAGVVGVPHKDSTFAARAFVILRPDCHATAAELQNHVAQRVPQHMRLHGGVRFVEKLPENRGGKLDRAALKVIAMAETTVE